MKRQIILKTVKAAFRRFAFRNFISLILCTVSSVALVVSGASISLKSGADVTAQQGDEHRGSGEMVRLSPSGNVHLLPRVSDQVGFSPQGRLLAANDGYLYGVSSDESASHSVLFRVGPDGGDFVVLYVFSRTAEGEIPTAGLIEGRDGYFYGTASQGGNHQRGTIFQFSRDGQLRVLHAFDEGEGASPQAELLLAEDGVLYGTTSRGGRNNQGTIFQLDTDGRRFQIVYEFNSSDGANPQAELIQSDDGWLAGVASAGGERDAGTVFRVSIDGRRFERLHAFGQFKTETSGASDGRHPLMVRTAPDGYLYGTTLRGGDFDSGVVFRMSPAGNDYAVLYSFIGKGDDPRMGLVTGPGGEISVPVRSPGRGDAVELLSLGGVIKRKGSSAEHPMSIQSTTITVTDETSLRNALATSMPGDTININVNGTITLTGGELVVARSLTITGQAGGQTTISGGASSRVFFVNPGAPGATVPPSPPFPVVRFSNLTIANGKAKGGDGGWGNVAGAGGGGAGMGGGLFINGGTVTIDHVTFSGNQAIGGNGGPSNNQGSVGGNGGGGFFSDGFSAGDGRGASGGGGGRLGGNGGSGGSVVGTPGSAGSAGGEGGGGGGGATAGGAGGTGGFAGGGGGGSTGAVGGPGGGPGGNGGFGGGGGGGASAGGAGGNGGMFGGTGGVGDQNFAVGGGGGGGAGLGGAIFLRLGNLTLFDDTFTTNSAIRGNGGGAQGRGGAIAINQGASASGCGNAFNENTATDGDNDVNGSLIALPPAVCPISGPDEVCAGSTHTYTGPAGLTTYSWSIIGNGTIVGPNDERSVNVTATGSGIFILTLKVTNANGCDENCDLDVSVNGPCSITGASLVCRNATGNAFTGPLGASLAYSWSIAGNGTIVGSNNQRSVSVTATDTGSFTLTLTVTDSSGCITTCTREVTVTEPACSITGPSTVCPGSTGNAFTGPAGLSYSWSVTGNGVIAGSTTSQSVSVTTTNTGSFTLNLTVTDANACTSTCNMQVAVLDQTPPTLTCPANITRGNDTNQCGAVVTYTNATATDDCSGGLTPSCTPSSGSFFQKGTTTVTCTVSDSASNQSSCSFSVSVNDTQAPAINCPPNKTQSTDPGLCSAVVTYNNATATDNCTGVGAPVCSPASGSTFPKGITTVTCNVSDASGNPASCSFTVTVNDTQPPSIICPPNKTQSTDPGLCSAVVTYNNATATDNCPGVGSPVCSPASGSTLPKGITTVTCNVSDASGNTAGCSFTITVNDTQPPAITCPSNITAKTANAGDPCVVVTFAPPIATDNCPGVTAVCNPPSGTCFPRGTTTVTCAATDTSGNATSCSFTVTVFDLCLQDGSIPGTVILINTATGDYRFCCNGTLFSGRGTMTIRGSTYKLEHNPADRRVLATVDESVHRGTATLQAPPGTMRCTITDTNTQNNNCVCQ